ncbi:MAG TPA: DUF6036 family nucleotidyltransferase [Vicinamibacterales bacterium]|nr:DUF6036 family nucleotidyltransferase [Vicinamibacterales bacterium]
MLRQLDEELRAPTELHCLGGFVIAEHYNLTRATADLDVIESKGTKLAEIATLAGRGSALHQRYKVFVDVVAVATIPDGYEQRLAEASRDTFRKLRLRVLERHDLVLAKLTRNSDRDRADVEAMAAGPGLDIGILRTRYRDELRYKLARPEREDLTLALWIEIIEEVTRRRHG